MTAAGPGYEGSRRTTLYDGPALEARSAQLDALRAEILLRPRVLRAALLFHAPACSGKRTILANSSASRLAPPTRAPSMSGLPMIWATFEDFTEPP